jgi:hypothetical protein
MRPECSNQPTLDSANQTILWRPLENFCGYELTTAPNVLIICKRAQKGGSVKSCQDTGCQMVPSLLTDMLPRERCYIQF